MIMEMSFDIPQKGIVDKVWPEQLLNGLAYPQQLQIDPIEMFRLYVRKLIMMLIQDVNGPTAKTLVGMKE